MIKENLCNLSPFIFFISLHWRQSFSSILAHNILQSDKNCTFFFNKILCFSSWISFPNHNPDQGSNRIQARGVLSDVHAPNVSDHTSSIITPCGCATCMIAIKTINATDNGFYLVHQRDYCFKIQIFILVILVIIRDHMITLETNWISRFCGRQIDTLTFHVIHHAPIFYLE